MKKLLSLCLMLFTLAATADQNEDLVKACQAGNLAEVKAQVEKGADVNYKGGTPINSAVFYADVVQYLLEKGAKANEGDNNALVTACVYGSPQVIKLLLDAGADPNKPL